MNEYSFKFEKAAIKFLKRQNPSTQQRIMDAIHKLPHEGDIKPMQGYDDGRKRLRVGGWRVIFRYGNEGELEILFVIDIGNRGDIYK